MKTNQLLQLPPGVVKSGTPASVQGRWADANLVRWHEGAMQPVGGWDRQTATPHSSLCRRLHVMLDTTHLRHTIMCCEDGLFVETSGTIEDITPSGFTVADWQDGGGYGAGDYGEDDYGTPRTGSADPFARPYCYSVDNWGVDILAVHSSDGRLMHWAASAPVVDATVVSAAPTGIISMVVTDERHVLLGGYGTGDQHRTIRWCSREDYTDWDLASTTNTAGELPLDVPGDIIGMAKVRDGVLVFTDTDTFLVRYVGQPFIYGVERIGQNCAPISPQAVAVVDGRAMWLGRSNFWSYDGGQIRVLSSEVGDFVFDEMSPTIAKFTACAGFNGVFPEIWFSFPVQGDTDNSITVMMSIVERWWGIARIGRTAMHPPGLLPYPTMTGPDKHTYQHETGWLAAGATRVGDVWAETHTVSLGNGDRTVAVLQGQPDSFTGYANSRFRFYARFSREGAETEYGPYIADSNGFLWPRFQARDIRLRVEANVDALWTVGSMRFAYAPKGRR